MSTDLRFRFENRVKSTRESIAETNASRVLLYLLLCGLTVFYLIPLETGVMTAFKTLSAFGETSPFAPPTVEQFTVEPWITAWNRLSNGLLNSALFAIPTTILSGLLGSLTAYGLTKVKWRGRFAVYLLVLTGVFVPYQAVLVPLTQLWTAVGIDSMVAGIPGLSGRAGLIELVFTHTAYGVPITTVLFRGYYGGLNNEIIEAARLDGASAYRIYVKVILPLSKPMFAVTFIYQFTQVWNDLLFALVLLTDNSNSIVMMELAELSGSMVQQFNLQMAGALLAALPTLIVYVLFTDQFASGVAGEGL